MQSGDFNLNTVNSLAKKFVISEVALRKMFDLDCLTMKYLNSEVIPHKTKEVVWDSGVV